MKEESSHPCTNCTAEDQQFTLSRRSFLGTTGAAMVGAAVSMSSVDALAAGGKEGPLNIVEKIFEAHRVSGELKTGKMIALKVDQLMSHDINGMSWLEFEAIGLDTVRVPFAISFVDHNMLQTDYLNPDDHIFVQTAAAKFGAHFSRPGNGVCHQVHLERFAAPGKIYFGTDSHTPTAGGMGMIGIGVGGLDVAAMLAGMPFEFNMPKVVQIKLTGNLQRPYVTAMDVILTILQKLTVKGGVGKIIEYGGPGVANLTLTERATITNMGAELGATTSIFPSDEQTRKFLKAQGREKDWKPLAADAGAQYDQVIEIDMNKIEPMIAMPFMPDKVVPIRSIAGKKVNQVCIGSCTNSSYQMMKTVSEILKGNTVSEMVSLLINPGSRQVYSMLAKDGSVGDMIQAGARMLESGCGPCIGMGAAPGSGQVSVRSYNRNFKGRSGTKDAQVYLASPISCAAMALKGEIIDPRDAGIKVPTVAEPTAYMVKDNMIVPPKKDRSKIQIVRGPNIKGLPVKEPLKDTIAATMLLKVGDNITTDAIMPSGAKVLPLRMNIPAISEYVFESVDKTFPARAKAVKDKGGSIIVGGDNYGQGSSREHAALAPMYLGVQAVIAKNIARIHNSNLINFGILPLMFKSDEDYKRIAQGDELEIKDVINSVKGKQTYQVENKTQGYTFTVVSKLNAREQQVIVQGGLLPYIKAQQAKA